jgi:NAD(P)-dependent dehydrogenase (short-subunit alcohol dehydrogenase family)
MTGGARLSGSSALMAGKTSIVTGAAQGLGAAITTTLAEHGAFVIATDVQFTDTPSADRLPPEPAAGEIIRLAHDVSEETQWAAVTAAVGTAFGALHVLVNDAAIAEQENLEDLELATWDRVLAVGLSGAWLGMKHCAPLLRAAGTAAVVNIGSIYGTSSAPWGRSPAYHAIKGGLLALTRNATALWAGAGIRVNTISPGIVRSGDQFNTPEAQRIIDGTPLGRMAEPEEIAHAVLFAASDWASYMTGAELRIDGGWSAV